MAIIHDTTLSPGKLELLARWLPAQPWYAGEGREPALRKAGGFRLDDPQGEVGIEFMVVTDGSADAAVTYQVPMTYRASALAGCDRGRLGKRPAHRSGQPDPPARGQGPPGRRGRAAVPFRHLAAA